MINLYAALLNEKLVLAIEEAGLVRLKIKKLNSDEYRCPHCQKRVILIVSQSKAAFFKHWIHYQDGQGEKEEHHNSKMLLKAAFTAAGFPAQTEIPLADGQLRADVLVSSKLALEVQCAPLSDAEFNKRHRLYQKINVLDLWIVGSRHYLKQRIKKKQLIFFRESQRWGCYYLEVDPQKNQLCLKYNIWQEPVTRKLRYQQARFSLDEFGVKKFWHFKPVFKKFTVNSQKQEEYLRQQVRTKTEFGLRIAVQLYDHHFTLEDLPAEIFQKWRKPGQIDAVSFYLQKKPTALD